MAHSRLSPQPHISIDWWKISTLNITWHVTAANIYLSASTDIKVWTAPLENSAKFAELSVSDLSKTTQVNPALNLHPKRFCK